MFKFLAVFLLSIVSLAAALISQARSEDSHCIRLGYFSTSQSEQLQLHQQDAVARSFQKTEDMFLHYTLRWSKDREVANGQLARFVAQQLKNTSEIELEEKRRVADELAAINKTMGDPFDVIVQTDAILFPGTGTLEGRGGDIDFRTTNARPFHRTDSQSAGAIGIRFSGRLGYVDLDQLRQWTYGPRLFDTQKELAAIDSGAAASILRLRKATFKYATRAQSMYPALQWDDVAADSRPNQQKEEELLSVVEKFARSRGYSLILAFNGVWFGQQHLRENADDLTDQLKVELGIGD